MSRTALVVLFVSLLALSTVPSGALAEETQASAGAEQSTPTSDLDRTAQASNTSEITYFRIEGRGYVSDQDELVGDHPGPPYVWESESLKLRTTVRTTANNNTKVICGRILDAEGTEIDTVDCTSWNATTEHRLSTLKLSDWPADTNGTHRLEIQFMEEVPSNTNNSTSNGNETELVVQDSRSMEVIVISKTGDLSNNGLSNAREVELGTDFTEADTDDDGLSDREEVYRYGSDPLEADTSGDGLEDGTIAQMMLPPTVPYVVHGTAGVLLLGLLGAILAGIRLRRWIESIDESAEVESTPVATEPAPRTPDVTVEEFPRSKEDEVIQTLREHGGQMKQADLVEETEWSKATVSRLLSTLEENGRIEKVRIGRGNVVKIQKERPPEQA